MTINALNIIPVKTASCSVMGDYAIKKKMNVAWGKRKVGDIVLFDFNHNGTSDHTGIVVNVNSDGTIDAIEGNTSQKSQDNGGNVMFRNRTKGNVNYFVRPKYNGTVTPQMVINTAISQLGTKESPSGSNKVKYNTWYYGKAVKGSAYPWCMTFVEWDFAHVMDAVSKPTGKYGGVIPTATVKNGSKGDNVKNLQKFLNWYNPKWPLTVDGECGINTKKAIMMFQNIEGIHIDGEYGKNSYAKANAYKASAQTSTPTPTPTTTPTPIPTPTPKPTASSYSGAFPTIPTAKIIECTRSVNGMRKHGLLSGDYTLRFKSEERRYKMCKFSLATVGNKKITYSNYPKFEDKVKKFGYNLAKVKALKTSANCSNFVDGAVGAVTGKYVRDLGAKHNKKYLTKTNYFTSHKYSKGSLLAGDICGTSKHTWMIIQGAYISVGCEGAEVKKWQNFLRWYGSNIAADGDFGMATLKATKDFQSKVGITADGIVGKTTIAKAKAVKK